MAINKPVTYAAPKETDEIARNLIIWLSAYKDLPVDIVRPEPMLNPGEPGLELTVIQGNITRHYIYGGHQSEFQFGVIYRLQPKSPDARLKAIETLNRLGDYAVSTNPNLGENVRSIKCEVTSQGALFATYDNNDEDYQILMKLTYEVI